MNLLFPSDVHVSGRDSSRVLSGGEMNPQFWGFNGYLFILLLDFLSFVFV